MSLDEFLAAVRIISGREFDPLRNRVRAESRAQGRRLSRAEQRVELLEEALARVAMLARALAETCLAKGVLTREELEQALLEADLSDGEQDGGLDPSVVLPGEDKPADLHPLDDDPPAPPR